MNVEVMVSMRKRRMMGRSGWTHSSHVVRYPVAATNQPKGSTK